MVITIFISLTACKAYYNKFYADPEKCFSNAILQKPYDAIIVPGFPYDSGKVNGVLSQRVKWACYLYQNHYANNIIFSGSAVYTPYVESEAMRALAMQSGIPEDHIFLETKAEHTTENIYYSDVLAKNLGFIKIAFATEPAQASFMKPFKKKFKLKMDFLPVLTDSLMTMNITFAPVDHDIKKLSDFKPITEREGFIKRLRGTRGAKVKKEIRLARKAHKHC